MGQSFQGRLPGGTWRGPRTPCPWRGAAGKGWGKGRYCACEPVRYSEFLRRWLLSWRRAVVLAPSRACTDHGHPGFGVQHDRSSHQVSCGRLRCEPAGASRTGRDGPAVWTPAELLHGDHGGIHPWRSSHTARVLRSVLRGWSASVPSFWVLVASCQDCRQINYSVKIGGTSWVLKRYGRFL